MAYSNAIFHIDYVNGSDAVRSTLSSCTASNPSGSVTRINKTNHGLLTGAVVTLSNFTAWLNTVWKITKIDADNFDLDTAVWQATADAVGDCVPFGGMSWADAWKTTEFGSTAARIAPGDIIKIAKSPDPTSLGMTALWTDASRSVVLNSAVTANIDLCETAWTASANVTCTTSATRKQGSLSTSHAIGASFTTGKVCYKDLGGTFDFSPYKQVSFWMRTNLAIASGVLTIDLCSDTVGATPVNTLTIPAVPDVNKWQVITIENPTTLGSAIKSVSINAVSDPGTATIIIDNILACKASSSSDSLTLSSLISKNSSAQGGSEGWFAIKNINGTTIELDNDVASAAGSGRGYTGVTETVTTYKREAIKTTVLTGTTGTFANRSMDSGTFGSNIEFQGGYNTSNGAQDGETFFDGSNGAGVGFQVSQTFNTFNWLSFVRYTNGLNLAGNNNYVDNISNANSCTSYGIILSSFNNYLNNIINVNNSGNAGISIQTAFNKVSSITNANNNTSSGIEFSGGGRSVVFFSNAKNNGSYGIRLLSTNMCKISNGSVSGNGTAGVGNDNGHNFIDNVLMSQATEFSMQSSFADGKLFSNRHNQTQYSYISTDGGFITSEASTLTNGSGTQWKFTTQTNTNRQLNYPLTLSIAKIACSANNQVTVKCWFLKGHASNIGAKLVCRGGQIAGVPSDVVATKANDTLEEELTITFTPTAAGVIEIEAWAYYVSGHSTVIIDKITITQA